MNRVAARAILGAALVAIVLPAVLVAGGIATRAWVPAVAVPPPTPTRADAAYIAFLDEVAAGDVQGVGMAPGTLLVARVDGDQYTVDVSISEQQIFDDVEAAAARGGVAMPHLYSIDDSGNGFGPPQLAWDDLLERVRSGRVFDVFHEGDQLQVSADDGVYQVEVPPDVDDVLAALEAAAATAGVPAPYYSKAPTVPEPS